MERSDDDQRREPPACSGTLLLELRCKRATERGRPPVDGCVRVTLDAYEGHPFVGLRFWAFDSEGRAWPTRVGWTIRVRELGPVLEALQRAQAQLPAETSKPAGGTWLDRHHAKTDRAQGGGPSLAAEKMRGPR